jgi:GNAT superfamily N-acetyltransferase
VEGARPAGPDDAPIVATMARALRAAIAGERGGELWLLEARPEPLEETLFAAPCVVVGTYDDAVAGYAVTRLDRLRNGAPLAVVEELWVEPQARGVGIGEAILDAVTAWAREMGATALDAVVLPGMRDGKNLFERAGMAARSLRPSKPLT